MAAANNNGDNGSSNPGSPMHLGLSGHFSHEDIEDLLGVMGDNSHSTAHGSEGHHNHHQPLMLTSSDQLQRQAAAVAAATTASTACTAITYGQDDRDTSSGAGFSADNNCNDTNNCVGEDAKAHARSERKRSREKQRRSDVNRQFTDLTQLLQKIDAEDAAAAAAEAAAAASNTNEELGSCDVKSSSVASSATTVAASRITFNPSNRVDLIGRTILQLERLHEANKRRKNEIASLQQQLDVAKKAGEDTAAKLKEAMLAPPGQPMTKQFMMMVPMMMSADGSGATSAVPMMNPYMGGQPAPVMPQAYCPMPQQHMFAPPAAAAAPAGQPTSAPAQAPASSTPTPPPVAQAPVAAATHHPMMAAPQQMGQPQVAAAPYPFMMQAPMGGGGYMMPVPTAGHHAQMQHHPMMAGQPMSMPPHQTAMTSVPQGQQQDGQSNIQEQKDSSPGMNGGSNLAHCA